MSGGPLRFDGQVAVVTGATSGLGREYALELARRGATVVGTTTARAQASGEADALLAGSAAAGLALQLVPADVTVETAARGLVTGAIEEHGRLDVLVNNAGSAWVSTIQEGTTAQVRAMLDVHYLASFWTTSTALQHMRGQGFGRIVNSVSGVAMFGRAEAHAYAAAKGAVLAMNQCAVEDNADVEGIVINAISPLAATGMAPDFGLVDPALDAERMSPTRVVPALIYLAHESCRLKGRVLYAAGGRVALSRFHMTRGWGSETLTAEDVSAHIDDICDRDGAFVLENSHEQFRHIPTSPADFAELARTPRGVSGVGR